MTCTIRKPCNSDRCTMCLNRVLAQTEKENANLRAALELIAAPKRPDGTYNRSREACEQLAREALAKDFTGVNK